MPELKITPDKSPIRKPSNQSPKVDELVAMSHIPVLMGLFQSFKEKSNFSDGDYCNLYPELKEALAEWNIDDFDPLIDRLSTKFDLIFSDEDLPDRIKEQIARLQIYLFISAMQEKELLKRSSNPARRLLDTVTRTEVDFAVEDQEEQSGYEFLRDQIDQIGNTPFIELSTYAAILKGYKAYIDDKPSLAVKLVKETVIDTEDSQESVESIEDSVVELEEDSVEDDVDETVLAKTEVETEVETPVIEAAVIKAAAQPVTKKDKIVPLADVKPVSMAEAMVRSISRAPEVKKPELVKVEKPVEPEATGVIEEVAEVAEVEEVEEAASVEAPAESDTPVVAEDTATLEKPEPPEKDSRDNIYPVIQSIVNDMTLPLRVQGRSLIFFDEVWTPLLLEVAQTQGFKSPAWQKILTIAKTQAWVLTPKSTQPELDKLMSSVGHIENSLSQSMQSLKLPVDQVVSLIEFLEHEQADVIAISEANIAQLKEDEKPQAKPKVSKAKPKIQPEANKPEKANLADTIDEFSTLMETGRFKKSKDMLKALNSDNSKQKEVASVSADTIHKSDWVEIKKGSSTVLAKLTWRAEDRSQFIFVDRNGMRVCEIDKDNLNKEFKAGTISLISSTPISSQRAAYSVIQTIK